MTRPWRLRFAGAKYHPTQRGNGAQRVFLTAEDYGHVLRQLDQRLEANDVTLYACVGRYFGYRTNGGVSKQRQRLARWPDPDGRLSGRVEKIEKALSKYSVQV